MMKLNNKISLKLSKESFDIKKIKNFLFEFFLSHSEIVFMVFFLLISLISGFLIYRYIFSPIWSEERKNSYIQEIKKGEVDFNISEFDLVIEKIKEKKNLYEKENNYNVRDIFGVE